MPATYYTDKHAEFEALAQRYVDHGGGGSRTIEDNLKGIDQHVVHSMACCDRVDGFCFGVMRWPVAYAHGKAKASKAELAELEKSAANDAVVEV